MASWNEIGRELILASQSARRKQILSQMGFRFRTIVPSVHDESAYINISRMNESLKDLAEAKARSVSQNNLGALVLGADTVVVVSDRVLGKPGGRAEAR